MKHQCYKRGFYGKDGQIEGALSEFESRVAPILQIVRSSEALPSRRKSEWRHLLEFVGLQSLRTPKSAIAINQLVDKLTKQVYSRDPRIIGQDLDRFQIGLDHAVLFGMQHLPARTDGLSDLSSHLLTTTSKSFIASDNPVFLYNQFCEGVDRGTTGSVLRGLQVFFSVIASIVFGTLRSGRLSSRFSCKTRRKNYGIDSRCRFPKSDSDYRCPSKCIFRALGSALRFQTPADRCDAT